MSFKHQIKKTLNSLKSKISNYKTEYNTFKQGQDLYSKIETPNSIKYNPYFIADGLRKMFMDKFRQLLNKKPKFKMLNNEETKNSNIVKIINENSTKVAVFVKRSALAIFERINHVVLKMTNFELKTLKSHRVTQMVKNVPSFMIHKVNVSALMIYKSFGHMMDSFNKKTLQVFNQYKDPKVASKYHNNYEGFFRNLETKAKNFKFFNKFDGLKNRLNFTDFSKNFAKVNEFIKYPKYKQKIYSIKVKLSSLFENMKAHYDNINFKNYKEMVSSKNLNQFYTRAKNIKFYDALNYVKFGIKNKLRNILFYISALLVVYYIFRYIFHRMTEGRNDRNLEETLKVVKDIQKQNEELVKYNQRLVETLISERKK